MIRHSVDTKTKYVRQIYDEVDSYNLPTIQRQFVWDDENIKKLIDSIVNNYPIGAVILWRPTSTFPSVPLVDSDGHARGRQANYIIDGQQRLTALLLIKNGWKITRNGKSIELKESINYLPESKKFRVGGRGGIDVSLIVRANLGDREALNELQSGRCAEAFKKYESDIWKIGKKIVDFPIPFYILDSEFSRDDYQTLYREIAEIFTRVNSEGVKLGRLEMFLSFFAGAFSRKTINVKERVTEADDKYGNRYGLDLEPILRFVFSNLGRNQNEITNVRQFEKAIERLKDDFSGKESKMNKIVNQCVKAIGIAMELIGTEMGIETTKYIPSQNVLLPIFQHIFNLKYSDINEIPTVVKNKMIKWFIIASFNGIYSGSPNQKIERDVKIVNSSNKDFPLYELLKVMKTQRGIETDTIEKYDIIEAYKDAYRGGESKYYLMLLITLLYRNKATNWAGEIVRFSEIPDRNTVVVHHIFPQEEMMKDDPEDEEYLKKYVNCIANLTLIQSELNSNLSDTLPIDYLPNYESELRAHLIPEVKKTWRFNNFEDFIERRLYLIWKATKTLLKSLDNY